MNTLIAVFAFATLAIHIASIAIAIRRCRVTRVRNSAPATSPAVSLVRPICGIDNLAEITLRSTFHLDYPSYEILFCVAQPNDPAIPLIERLIAAYPRTQAQLLIGDDRVSDNPKLNNCVKGWHAAAHGWIVLADSNVLMPPDYLTRLIARWDDTTGLVCSPPVGGLPGNFWAGVECAILNTYQARWQYTADTLGAGYAQGKSMLWRRDILDSAGGICALGSEAAEDAAATKLVRAQGLRVKLADGPFMQPLGRRTAAEVWRRQTRWAQLRRSSFPHTFAPEILSTPLWTFAACAVTATNFDASALTGLMLGALIWYAPEAILCRMAGWPLARAYPLQALVRDVMLPGWWISGWLGRGFEWRGHLMTGDVVREAQS